MSWGKPKVVKAISKDGDPTPEGYCSCGRKAKRSRTHFGTCGRGKCLQKMQAKALGPVADQDGHDPGKGARVKVDGVGSVKTVKYTKSVRGVDCAVLQDGTTIPTARLHLQ